MKKIIIGRNNACDIIIPDTTDLVSRKQAVLTISPMGKMILFDTSNNGTYVNGQRIEQGKGVPVTRKDKITFAQVADLDWNEVKDPYRQTKIWALVATLVLAALVAGLVWWMLQRGSDDKDTVTPPPVEMAPTRGETISTLDSTATAAPATTDKSKAQPAPRAKRQAVSPKGKSKAQQSKKDDPKPKDGKDVLEKDVNDKTPIVY